MKNLINIIMIIVFITVVAMASGLFYILPEGKQAIITQFGKPIKKPVVEAGLHFKIPIYHKVNIFEKRILEWDGYPNQIPTKDKRYIWVDTTARWRISDPLLFLQSIGTETQAYARLDDIIDSIAREVITSHLLIDFVRNSNRVLDKIKNERSQMSESQSDRISEKIEYGREKLTRIMLAKAKAFTKNYGIEIIDIRVKRINYVEDVRRKVYERMISERQQAAERYRSEGRGESAEIEGKKVRELQIIESEAYRKAQEIKGSADAEALTIYAESFNKDPEFYSFMKTLESYKDTIDKKSTVILTTDSDYYRYLKSAK